jgi:hypothetical protein
MVEARQYQIVLFSSIRIIPPAGGIQRGGLVTSPSNSKKKTIYDKSTQKHERRAISLKF